MEKQRKYFLIGIIFCTGIVFGVLGFYLFYYRNTSIVRDIRPIREKSDDYAFINPLLFYDGPNNSGLKEYQPISSKIQDLVEIFNRDKDVETSVYYRDLIAGRWVGVNEDKQYTPASLMKIVVMIAYLKQAENNPSVLFQKIKFTEDIKEISDSLPYDKGTELQLDQSYTIDELINRMIISSDNGATYALLNRINEKVLDQVYSDLGLENPIKLGREYTISTRYYAFFLRILYNATYLNRFMSERALSILSKSEFKEGLVAGIPGSTVVAHKYGEGALTDKNNAITSVELHDCGIVYYPERPYLLCVMTKGKNISDLADIIKIISQAVYEKHASK